MSDDRSRAVETAWRIHDAQVTWTGHVDSKASIVLAVESGIMAGVVTLFGEDRRLAHLEPGWTTGFAIIGIALLTIGVLAVAFAVRPWLRSRKVEMEATSNWIFFGHIRHWKEPDLSRILSDGDVLRVLSHQLIVMAEVCWRKHRSLQVSMTSAAMGTALVAIAAALNG